MVCDSPDSPLGRRHRNDVKTPYIRSGREGPCPHGTPPLTGNESFAGVKKRKHCHRAANVTNALCWPTGTPTWSRSSIDCREIPTFRLRRLARLIRLDLVM